MQPSKHRAALISAAALVIGMLPPVARSTGAKSVDKPALIEAWRTVRQMDCARCHGKDHRGLSAPSVLEFVRTQDRDRFNRIVLDGDVLRGMPGYRSIPRVADAIDAIYLYFRLRADGLIDANEPFSSPRAAPTPP